MSHTDHLTATITVDHTPEEVFAAVTDVRGWWNANIIGATAARHDEFVFTDDCEYPGEAARADTGIRFCRFRITEFVPGARVVWHVVDSYLGFVADHDEWTGTDVVFDIAATPEGTTLHFVHRGLTASESECFQACSRGWTFYITKSLPQLLATGAGDPIAKY
ncbi:SRPBCC domain-containing protein [Nocardia sp. N2S4-5]|uniref:SRPBCC domain-containing protein n=1 Tax=Nocardia sp. N2S4-5 TaxID=3351565 RepID=UPI0037D293C1